MIKYIVISFVFITQLAFCTDSLQVSDIGSSARMISMGNIEGFSQSSNAIFENPAALHSIQKNAFSSFGTRIFDEAKYANFSYSWRSKWGNWALGHMFVYVDGIAQTDISNDQFIPVSYFGYRNSLSKLAFQRALSNRLFLGTSLNYTRISLDDITGNGINADLGFKYYYQNWSVSVLGKNLIRPLKINYSEGKNEHFPLQLLLGSAYNWRDVTLYTQVKKRSSHQYLLKAAAVSYTPVWMPVVSLNGGLKEYDAINQNYTTASFGMGLTIDTWSFHYAYEKSDHPNFNNFNYFSISWLN